MRMILPACLTLALVSAASFTASTLLADPPYILESPNIAVAAGVTPNRSILIATKSAASAVSNAQYTLEVGQVYGLLAAYKGDFNNDFVITQSDVNTFVDVLLGLNTSAVDAIEADMNGDGAVDANDINALVQAMLAA